MNETLIKKMNSGKSLPKEFMYIKGWANSVRDEIGLNELIQGIEYLKNDNVSLFKLVVSEVKRNLIWELKQVFSRKVNRLLSNNNNEKKKDDFFSKIQEVLLSHNIRVQEKIVNILLKTVLELQNKECNKSLWIKALKGNKMHKFKEIKKHAGDIYFRIFFYHADNKIYITDIRNRSDKDVFSFNENPPIITLEVNN